MVLELDEPDVQNCTYLVEVSSPLKLQINWNNQQIGMDKQSMKTENPF